MTRVAGIVAFLLVVGLAAVACGEIVKVTADRTTIYDAEAKETRSVDIKGKCFMVYGISKGWYLVEMTIGGRKTFRWIPCGDAEIDWGKTKTARVAAVVDSNTLKLVDGELVRFCGVDVGEPDSSLSRRTRAWLKTVLEGEEVVLEYDAKFKAGGGRDLAYVYVGGEFINRMLVKHGLATVPFDYASGGGRYAGVFRHFLREAKAQGLGIWAEEPPAIDQEEPVVEETPPEPEEPSPAAEEPASESEPVDSEPVQVLSQAQKLAWARNLHTEIKVAGKYSKTKKDVYTKDQYDEDEYESPVETRYVWQRTLDITLQNGWGFAVEDITIEYEFYGKTGRKFRTVALHKGGEIADVDLKAGETRQLTCGPVEFVAVEENWGDGEVYSGFKYHGYRLTFVYRGTPVKVVANPATLVDFEP